MGRGSVRAAFVEMKISIQQAKAADTDTVCSVLREAATWLLETGQPLWQPDDLVPARIGGDIQDGLYYLAKSENEPAGVMRFQMADPDFWPDVPEGTSTFVHRLAVRRRFAGQGVSTDMLNWAVQRTRQLGRTHLRLDCEASRPKLRAVYERFGFVHHSDRAVGPYFVARYEYCVADANRSLLQSASNT